MKNTTDRDHPNWHVKEVYRLWCKAKYHKEASTQSAVYYTATLQDRFRRSYLGHDRTFAHTMKKLMRAVRLCPYQFPDKGHWPGWLPPMIITNWNAASAVKAIEDMKNASFESPYREYYG